MNKKVLLIDGMSCSHCANKVKDILIGIDGVNEVFVDLENKKVTLLYDNDFSLEEVQKKLEDDGYKLIDVL